MDDASDYAVLAVKMRARHIANKELRAIGVRTSVGHRDQTLVSVLDPDALISELGSVDTLVALTIRSHNLATLHHEVSDHTLDRTALVEQISAHFSCAESSKVLDCLGEQVLEQLNNDPLFTIALLARLSDLDVHERLMVVDAECRHGSKQ